MLEFRNVSKSFRLPKGERKSVLKNANVVFPAREVVGLLGRNGAGKSTTLRMIAGTQDHDAGRIIRRGSVSWPIGFAGSFHPDLTGAQNIRFVARVYGVDTDALEGFVKEFSELGAYFHMPFRTYSSGMRARLAFGVSMGVPFDTYLVDEVTTVGDTNFRQKCNEMFTKRLAQSGAIVVSHSLPMIAEICTSVVVLEQGQLQFFDDVDAGIEAHSRNPCNNP